MTKLKTFLGAVAGGLCISIGGTVYLSCESKVAGAILFAVGLFAICVFSLGLFTGKIGYVLETGRIDCVLIWLGNLVGTVLGGTAIRFARPAVAEACVSLTEAKLALPFYQTLILGFFCGVLMYIAVHNFRTNTGALGKYIGIFTCVPVFILCGFEHSVADMFYLAAGITSLSQLLPAFLFLLIVTLANGLGAVAFRFVTMKATAEKA